MSRFRLATLERLRTELLEERRRALRATNEAVAERAAALDRVEADLATTTTAQTALTPADLVMLGARRDRLRDDRAAAAAELSRSHEAAEAARAAWMQARSQLKAVTMLHDRHRAATAATIARREQRDADERAAAGPRHPEDAA